jgi:hypothetical protein
MRMNLLVISDRNPKNWSDKQKEGWTYIEYTQFPTVPPTMTSTQILVKLAPPICDRIEKFYQELDKDAMGFVVLQGEASLCKAIFDTFHGKGVRFVFPVTETKNFEFDRTNTITEFVQWREI